MTSTSSVQIGGTSKRKMLYCFEDRGARFGKAAEGKGKRGAVRGFRHLCYLAPLISGTPAEGWLGRRGGLCIGPSILPRLADEKTSCLLPSLSFLLAEVAAAAAAAAVAARLVGRREGLEKREKRGTGTRSSKALTVLREGWHPPGYRRKSSPRSSPRNET
ncbi:hypothetical protein KM043_004209 [Ampulex compressa]|nr:hypothetical protein KM043_004209 [Ampulex compressa]